MQVGPKIEGTRLVYEHVCIPKWSAPVVNPQVHNQSNKSALNNL